MTAPKLELGWCLGYMALQYHMEEALIEEGLDIKDITASPSVAKFSKKYYNDINNLDHSKKYDYCFIGSIKSCVRTRQWVIDFAKKYFTCRSVFVNTDNDPTWKLLGDYDYSKINIGFCPKNQADSQSKCSQYRIVHENIFYFETMCQSMFTLCPAGDAPWSFRFYEILMCKTIPIVQTWHHTYRTIEESKIPYSYILYDNIQALSDTEYTRLVDNNNSLFKENHLF